MLIIIKQRQKAFHGIVKKNNFQLSHYSYVHKVNNSGIWPIIICETTLLCLNNPDSKIKFLFVPSPIRAKYYPFIIISK